MTEAEKEAREAPAAVMPTTAEVREAFSEMSAWDMSADEADAAFDRWLSALIAEKQAEALEQAADMVTRGSAVTLRAIAQRLREQGGQS